MAPESSPRQSRSYSKQKPFLICLLLVSILLLCLVPSVKHDRSVPVVTRILDQEENTKPAWFKVIAKGINSTKNIKVGLVNINTTVDGNLYEQLDALHPQLETVSVHFDHIDENLKWEDLYPEWIDEDGKWGQPKCPDMPMPGLENYGDLNVVVARVPCRKEGIRDMFRLQVNLVVANLAVESGWVTKLDADTRKVYVVFVGSCGPMVEIFRCDDLLMHQGEYWVYKPDLRSLKQKTLMPVGSCQIAPGYAQGGKELWRPYKPKFAYVTILHTSEAYVCGAIALAQSIVQTKYIHQIIDLLLLADKSIGPESIRGLKAAGWKIKRIQRIFNPFAKKGTYNEWNYSKLRIWQLTEYDKIIFIDADLLVVKNFDNHFFAYPQLSASPNEYTLFNSGLMIIEPSQCMFENLMKKVFKAQSYNGGDQGFLNEIFTWWHRLPSKLNYLKSFERQRGNEKHEIPEDVYFIHYLGLKPWMCYRDYDCNWDMQDHHIFASDSAHQRWWQVYDAMPKQLQSYCGLTKKMDERIIKWRTKARNASLPDGHWKIEVKDPRSNHYVLGSM